MKKLLLLLTMILASSVGWGAQTQTQAMLNIRETDGSPSNYPYQFKVPNGSLTDGSDGTMTLAFSGGIISTNTLQSGTTIYISSGTIVTFYSSTATITSLTGTATNNNASVGSYGEYISSINVVAANAAATGQFGNVAQVSLTAGDWDVSGCGFAVIGTAVPTRMQVAVSAFSGNTLTDHILGYNTTDGLPPTSVVNMTQCISSFRATLASTTIIYVKVAVTYPANNPQVYGTITARRAR